MRSILFASAAAPLALLAYTPVCHAQAAIPQAGPNSAPSTTPSSSAGLVGSRGDSNTTASPSPTTSTTGSTSTLGEVVVTAQRRSENLQKAAVAVDAVSGADLVRNNITDPTTLNTLSPGLRVSPGGGGNVFYFIRGVGNFSSAPFSDPAVAFNYDNVYIGRPVASTGPFYDLERVEVVKGPQGTLYGRNATGGAINVVPEKPRLDDVSGYINASYGNYDAYDVEGAVNAPLGSFSAVRISGAFIGHDGYLNDGTSDEDTKAGRIQFLSRPTSKLSVRVSADYADISGVGEGSTYVDQFSYNRATGQYVAVPSGLQRADGVYSAPEQAYLQGFSAYPAGRNAGALAPYPFIDNKLYGVNAQIDYDTPLGRLTLIPAWRPSSINDLSSAAGFVAATHEDDEQYSTELRFAGNRIAIFDYTFGALYYHEREKGVFAANLQSLATYQTYTTFTDAYAGFARATAHLTDKLRLVGGVRYTTNQKSFDGTSDRLAIACTRLAVGQTCPTAPLIPFSYAANGQPLPVPAASGGVVPLIGTGAIVSRADFNQDSAIVNDRTTYRGAIEYDLTPRSLLYGSVETGFRSGGFSLAVGYGTYRPEYITAYTVGSKNRFFDNKLELNLEAFVWNYRDQQISHLGIDLSGQNANFTQNIGRSINEGLEAEGRLLLTPSTELNANVQYLDATYGRFTYQTPAINGAPPYVGCAVTVDAANTALRDVNCSGKQSFNSPEWTLNLGAQQTAHFGAYKVVGYINTQYLTSRYIGFEYQPAELAPPVFQTNGQVTLSPNYAKWSLSIFVQNLENNRYPIQAIVNTSVNILSTVNANPRTFGGRVSYKF